MSTALTAHVHCAECQLSWFADGKPTEECPRCGGVHLRAGSAMLEGGLLDCEHCGADYNQPCIRRGAAGYSYP